MSVLDKRVNNQYKRKVKTKTYPIHSIYRLSEPMQTKKQKTFEQPINAPLKKIK